MPRNILFAVTGLYPNIITQAISGFYIEKNIAINELIILTTKKGRDLLEKKGNDSFNEAYEKLKSEYDISIPAKKVNVISDNKGRLLEDVYSNKEYILTADCILNSLRTIKLAEKDRVYCIYSGGRHIMSSYLMSALSLVGDNRYSLYYISQNPKDEKIKIFYKPKNTVDIPLTNGKTISSSEIRFIPEEVIYPRLGLKYSGLLGNNGYQEAIEHFQEFITSEEKPVRSIDEGISQCPEIIGKSPSLLESRKRVKKFGQGKITPIVLEGPTGSGKELLALEYNYWHQQQTGKPNKFIAINCGALPEQLIESELFGYKSGGHATAYKNKKGLLDMEDGAVAFLDEINSASFEVQTKLLRLVQNSELQVIGSEAPKKVEIMLVFGTNEPLEELVENGSMREDFYYRINKGKVNIPSLSERKEDIPDLINFFFDKECKKLHKNTLRLSNDLLEKLTVYSWPGNVRELENYISSLIILTEETGIITKMIEEPKDIIHKKKMPSPDAILRAIFGEQYESNGYTGIMQGFEEWFLRREFEKNHKNVNQTADAIKLPKSTLKDKLKRYNIQ